MTHFFNKLNTLYNEITIAIIEYNSIEDSNNTISSIRFCLRSDLHTHTHTHIYMYTYIHVHKYILQFRINQSFENDTTNSLDRQQSRNRMIMMIYMTYLEIGLLI